MGKYFHKRPNLGDDYAEYRTGVHPDSGAKKIEILYGATDAEGNPVYPKNAKTDGHGHLIALEIDGLYQAVSWREPREDGDRRNGQQVYPGAHGCDRKNNALNDLEQDLQRRGEIIKDIRKNPGRIGTVLDTREWDTIPKYGFEKEQKLQRDYERAVEQFKRRQKKRELIEEAKRLQRSTNWAQTTEQYKNLTQQWKEVKGAGKEFEDQLWEEFKAAKQVFFNARDSVRNVDWNRNQAQKEALIAKAKSLSYSRAWKETAGQYRQMMDQWKKIGPVKTKEKNDELWSEFQLARKVFFDAREKEWRRNQTQKEEIVQEAKELSYSADWKGTHHKFVELMDRWKRLGTTGNRDKDEELWNSFNSARDIYYANQAQANREKLDAKKRIVSQAQSLKTSTEWNQTRDLMDGLFREWKKIGSTHDKNADDTLWTEFNGARDYFYKRRKEHFEAMDAAREEHARQKRQIVYEAQRIVSTCDYSTFNTEAMKHLDVEWKQIGPAGRAVDNELWAQFKKAKDDFWESKRRAAAVKREEWVERIQRRIQNNEDFIQRLYYQIQDLESKAYDASPSYAERISGWIEEKRDKIQEVELENEELRQKLYS